MEGDYRVPAPPSHNLRENYRADDFAPLFHDAYRHASRQVPAAAARLLDLKARILATRVLPPAEYLRAWEGHGVPSCGLSLSSPSPLATLCLDGRWTPPIPSVPPLSFACYGQGVPVLDGERILAEDAPISGGPDAGQSFRQALLYAYALFLLATPRRSLLGYDFLRWPDTWESAERLPLLAMALPAGTGPRNAWAALFATYYAVDAYTRAQLDEEWGVIPGLREALLAG